MSLLNVLFPPRCLGCQKFCDTSPAWCAACEQARTSSPGEQGSINGVDFFAAHSFSCKPVAAAIHALKYQGITDAAKLMGHWLEEVVAHAHNEYTMSNVMVVPVPLHPLRRIFRGYNQAELLARACAPGQVEASLLVRARYAHAQATSSAQKRVEHMQGAFKTIQHPSEETLYVVLDDVITTGNTLRACADALWSAGARSVIGVALARA